ncbi:MAG: hypothetical protein ABL998_02130 [Planctomycetota bacterium]
MDLLRSLGRPALCALTLASALLWLAGCFRYSSVGLDHNLRSGEAGLVTYYRVRWPGDGSLWVGRSSHRVPRAQLSRYPLEPGGRLLGSPVIPRPSSRWNRLGFWCVTDVDADPLGMLNWPDPVQSHWLGMPGWLPTLLLFLWWRRWWRRRPTSTKGRPG